MSMDANCGRRGRFNEIRAWLWLAEEGYDVFDNVTPNGPVDCIAYNRKTKEVILIEIKTGSQQGVLGRVYCPRLTRQQYDAGIKLLMVMKDGSCRFASDEESAPRTRSEAAQILGKERTGVPVGPYGNRRRKNQHA